MTTTSSPAIACEKCKAGAMDARVLPRYSGGLRFIGYVLTILSMFAIGFAFLMLFGVAGGSRNASRQDLAFWTKELRTIEGLPADVVEDFAEDGVFEEASLAKLTDFQRAEIQRIRRGYASSQETTAVATSVATNAAGCGVVTMFVFVTPVLIIGLLLLRKRKVWRCGTCGYVFDRA